MKSCRANWIGNELARKDVKNLLSEGRSESVTIRFLVVTAAIKLSDRLVAEAGSKSVFTTAGQNPAATDNCAIRATPIYY